jgi:hypothetical protein
VDAIEYYKKEIEELCKQVYLHYKEQTPFNHLCSVVSLSRTLLALILRKFTC